MQLSLFDFDFQTVCNYTPFPQDNRHAVEGFSLRAGGTNYCLRITAYLSPLLSGAYMFAVYGSIQAQVQLDGRTIVETTPVVGEFVRDSSFRVDLRRGERYSVELVGCVKENDVFKLTLIKNIIDSILT